MRSRPARSGRTSTSTRPASPGQDRHRRALVGADLADQRAARAQPGRRAGDDLAQRVETVRRRRTAPRPAPSPGPTPRRRGRPRPGRAGCSRRGQPAGQLRRQGVEPRAPGHPHGRARPAHAGQVGARHIERAARRPRRPRSCTGRGNSSSASARAMAPEPVPRSAITRGSGCPAASSRATSTTSSVSGRGISTRRSTSRSSRRKAQCPSTYWSGSPARRRATMASSRATARCVAGSSSPSTHSAPSRPLASWHSQRASPSSPSSSAARGEEPAPRWSRRFGSGELAGPLVGHQRARPPRPARRPGRAAACRA